MGTLTLTQVLTNRKHKGVEHKGDAKVSTHALLAKEEPKKQKAEEPKAEEQKAEESEESKAEESKESKAEKQRRRFKGV